MPESPDPSNETYRAGLAGLFKKLAEVMGEIGHVPKRGHNDFHNYDYVMEADLTDAVRAKLAERNVVVLPDLQGIDERDGKRDTITTARVRYWFCDGETGATWSSDWAGQGADPSDKGLYKAYTGAEKYLLMKSFLVPTGDDPEADESADERAAAKPAAKKAPKARRSTRKPKASNPAGAAPDAPQNTPSAPPKPPADHGAPPATPLDEIRDLYERSSMNEDELWLVLRAAGVGGDDLRKAMADMDTRQLEYVKSALLGLVDAGN